MCARLVAVVGRRVRNSRNCIELINRIGPDFESGKKAKRGSRK